MKKLVIFATIEVEPGTRDAAMKVLVEHRARCLRDEPGTIQFDVLIPDDQPMLPGAPVPEANPNAIMLFEVYEDHAAFAAHWKAPSLAQARKEAGVKFVRISGVPFQFAGS
jgi:quinol monooxygenase YgiN